jgi:hypothetical protein
MEKRTANIFIVIGSLLCLFGTVYELIIEKQPIRLTQIINLFFVTIALASVIFQKDKKEN